MKAAAALLALAGPASAQGLDDFMSAFEQRGAPYGYTRCAGFYEAVLDRATASDFTAEQRATIEGFARAVLRAAVAAEAEVNEAGMSGAAIVVRTEMLRFQTAYGERFNENFMTRGAILGEDAQMVEDNTICRQLADLASAATTEEATE